MTLSLYLSMVYQYTNEYSVHSSLQNPLSLILSVRTICIKYFTQVLIIFTTTVPSTVHSESHPTLIFFMCVSRSIMSDSLWPHGLYPTRLLLSMEFFWQEYWSSHSLVQGIFPTQGSNLGLLHSSRILYCLRHLGSFFMNTV